MKVRHTRFPILLLIFLWSVWMTGCSTTTKPESVATVPTTKEENTTNTADVETPVMTMACFTDMHIMQSMLDYPTTMRQSTENAIRDILSTQGPVDVALVGGDNLSDYPYYNRSCALPYRNYQDIKQKLVDTMGGVTKTGQVLYVAGNHDYALGELPTPGENESYNSAEYYETGPMKQTLGTLSDADGYWGTSNKLNGTTGRYLLAYHYVLYGYDFFGISPHPDDMFFYQTGDYDAGTLSWLKNKIDEVDPDGNKPIFVLGHLSTATRKNGAYQFSMDHDAMQAVHDAFDGHRNLFYFYGHVHGQGYTAQAYTAESVIHYKAGESMYPVYVTQQEESSRQVIAQKEEGNFTLVHMGGLRPFTSKSLFEYFEEDGLKGYGGREHPSYQEATGTPKLAQYMMVTVYHDRIVFQMRNTGTLPGYTTADIIAPYTVYLN